MSARISIQASGAQTTGSNSANVRVGPYRELLLLLNVTAVSGTTPSLQFFVDTVDDAGNFYQIASGSAITAAGGQTIGLGAGVGAAPVLFGDTIRLRWTIAGTTPSFTFSAAAIAK